MDCLRIIFIDENNFKEMIKNKFSSFVIEKSFQIIISIDENYFNSNIKNNFNKQINNFEFNSSESEEEKDENANGNKINNNEIKENKNDNCTESILDYDNFILFKNKIFYIFQNNASNKEKEKVINLLKQNYTFHNYVNNKMNNGNKSHKNC